MALQWRRDMDAALADAPTQKKPVLLDLSAGPM